jgi:hypothetical protein
MDKPPFAAGGALISALFIYLLSPSETRGSIGRFGPGLLIRMTLQIIRLHDFKLFRAAIIGGATTQLVVASSTSNKS